MGGDGGRDRMEKPLRGAVLCCTSILPEQRASIAEVARQMGAEHKLDLTSDVTHLLVGDVNTPKYKYVAREREDVKVLRPDWVEAVRQAWMHADDFDLVLLETEYELPIFAGLAICLTGFDDLGFRAQMSEQITINGGEYRGDLTKSVSHLIAYTTEGKKYQYAKQWGIKVVSLKWLKESLERTMVLDEDDYDPTIPSVQQGLKAWNREAKDRVQASKRAREIDVIAEPPRKLRRTASARLGSQNDSLWRDIVSGRDAAEEDRSHLRPSKSMSSVRPVVLEAKSFATDTTDPDATLVTEPERRQQAVPGMFQHTAFTLQNFTDRQNSVLRRHLSENGAVVVDSEWELPSNPGSGTSNFILVPYSCRGSDLPSLELLSCSAKIVTDFWLERCLLGKTWIDPETIAMGSPVQSYPVKGFERLVINATAFEGIERLHVAKLVGLLGAKYSEEFDAGVSILLCNTKTPKREKLASAKAWNKPVVTADWFWACVRSGKFQPLRPYAIWVPDPRKETRKSQIDEEHLQKNGGVDLEKSNRPRAGFVKGPGNQQNLGAYARQTSDSMHQRQEDVQIAQERGRPLKEISPNSPHQDSLSPKKQEVILGYDGPASFEGPSNPPAPDPTSTGKTTYALPAADSISDAIEQLLKKQTTRTRSNSGSSRPNGAENKKRLLGRALSNMSNSSRDSSMMRPSRASSVDSINTDGVGSIITDEPTQTRKLGNDGQAMTGLGRSQHGNFTGRASTKASLHSIHFKNANEYSEQAEVVEEPEPQMTQLGYANPEDAVLLRELIVDKAAKKSEIDVKADNRIRDDMWQGGWGQGRRTRTKGRGANDDDDLL